MTNSGAEGSISIISKDEIMSGAHRQPPVPLTRRASRTFLGVASSNRSAGSDTIESKAQKKFEQARRRPLERSYVLVAIIGKREEERDLRVHLTTPSGLGGRAGRSRDYQGEASLSQL
jgi:hypothetical protein